LASTAPFSTNFSPGFRESFSGMGGRPWVLAATIGAEALKKPWPFAGRNLPEVKYIAPSSARILTPGD
jgi:hypothetical protein